MLYLDIVISNIKPDIWFMNNIEYYHKYPNISIFIQNEGEVVFIPHNKYHFVVNLEPSYGIIYENSELGNYIRSQGSK